MRFLHVSDIHLLDLRGVRLWRYANKRITGRLNLVLHRGRRHDESIFDRIVERGQSLGVDRVVVTGDLTNLSLESEFEYCRSRLAALRVPVTVVPGNHDAYTRRSARLQVFERYMAAFMDGERLGTEAYPFIVRTDGVAMIGVSTAVATPPFVATGRIGAGQLERLGRMLERAADEQRARVVLLHHPPTPGVAKPRHDLTDLEGFGAVLRRFGAELVLHGHEHRSLETELRGPNGPIPIHGIASGTSRSTKPGRRASFSIYDVSPQSVTRVRYEWDGQSFAPAT